MIRHTIAVLIAGSVAATPGLPLAAAEVQIAATGPVVELTVSESVAVDPDLAELSAGVTTRAATAVEAMRLNSEQMARVVERIEQLGVAREDIQTSGVTLNAEYDYDQPSRAQVFRGYQVSNRVSVTLRDIARTGRVLDALVAAGATDLGGISWSVDDPEPAREQARQAAFAAARDRAITYARMAEHGGVRLLEVSESVAPNRPTPMYAARAESVAADVPVRPGQVETGVTVTVKFEMTD